MKGDSSVPDATLVSAFISALKEALKSLNQSRAERIRSGRLLRTLFTSHDELVKHNVTLDLDISEQQLLYGELVLHDDSEDEDLPELASSLYRSGLKTVTIEAKRIPLEDLRCFVEILRDCLKSSELDEDLVTHLWRLNLPNIHLRATDPFDRDSWSYLGGSFHHDPRDFDLLAEGGSSNNWRRAVSQTEFLDDFRFRVRQALSGRLHKARVKYSRMALEGNVSGDSLSMESHFNLVFGNHGSSQNLQKVENTPYEPVLVERLAASLREGTDEASDDELRTLLRERLLKHRPFASDRALLKRSVVVVRGLEQGTSPILQLERTAMFYLNVLRAAVALGDLEFLAQLFETIVVDKGPTPVLQAVDIVVDAFANADDLESLVPLVNKSNVKRGLGRTRAIVHEILLRLPPATALEALVAFYAQIREEDTRLAFQIYFTSESTETLKVIGPILEASDKQIMKEGFDILVEIGKPAVPVLEKYLKSDKLECRRLAWSSLRVVSGSLHLVKRDELLSALDSGDDGLRGQSLEILAGFIGDDLVSAKLEALIQAADFADRPSDERRALLDAFAAVAGEKASPLLSALQNSPPEESAVLPRVGESEDDRSGTRRVTDAAARALKSLKDDPDN